MGRLVRELKPTFPQVQWVWFQTSKVPPAFALSTLFRPDPADRYISLSSLKNGLKESNRRINDGLAKVLEHLHSSLFTYHGVRFADVFEKKIERGLFAHLRDLAGQSRTVRDVLQKVKPSLVLSPAAADADGLLGEWTRKLAIPSLSITHGTHTPSHTRVDEIEKERLGSSLILTSYERTALQTPWAEKFVSQVKSTRVPRPLKTGNLILAKLSPSLRKHAREELFGKAADDMKLIVYATTLKPRSGLRFQIHETLDEHLEGIADLSLAIREIPNATLLVKLHPAAALKEEEVAELVPETKTDRVRIACRMPFETALSAADLLVSYSSTCIEEAIMNRIPVMLYDPWNRYQHLPAYRWETGEGPRPAPAYYVNDRKFLIEALDWILTRHDPAAIPEQVWDEHIFPPETRNEFLRFVEAAVQ